MRLIFEGHEDRYAVEQGVLAFFPEEHFTYEEDPEDKNWAKISLKKGPIYTTVTTKIFYQNRFGKGISRTTTPDTLSDYDKEGLRQRTLKLSFFKAAADVLGFYPTWGALTGVRPAKLAARYLEQGKTRSEVNHILKDTYFVSAERRELCIETAQMGIDAKKKLQPRDISLYIGIPFCPTRCAYCSFVSQSVEKSFSLMDPYLEVLLGEISKAARMVKDEGLNVKTFYMGGGTPTTLSSLQMDRLLSHLTKEFDFSSIEETCIEAGRPDTIDREKLQVLLDHGIQRISVNPQSLEDHVLNAIGRKHSASDVLKAMELAVAMGFPHVNMDLIAGLPEDTPDGFRRTLDTCLSLGADNITVHTLALKKGSRILLEGLSIPSAEAVSDMLDYSLQNLRGHGFHPYYLYRQKYMSGSFENVGWCKENAECYYNIYIMEELQSILSLGAGGSTKMVDPVSGNIERVFHAKYPNEYIQRSDKIEENISKFAEFYHKNPIV